MIPRVPFSAVALGLLLPLVAGAQGADVPLTLADAVRRATTVGPAAALAAGRRASIVGRARTDAQWANPTLELRRENEGAPIPYDDFATLTLPIDITGRRFALRSALGAARTRAVADSIATTLGTEYATAVAWWESWAADQLAQFAAAQADRFTELARYDSLRAAEGEVAEATAMRMQLEADRARFTAAQARAAAINARALLAALVGRDDPASLVLGEAVVLADVLPDEPTVIATARRDHPLLAVARAAAREAERRHAAESRGALPDVGLSGGYKGTAGYSTATFGVILTPPLLNLNGGNRERTAGEELIANAELRAAELRVVAEARAALASARALEDGTAAFDKGFAARADLVASAADAAYREGAATLTELLEAHRARADARAAGVRGQMDRALTRLALRRAIGASALEAK
ncbi:MAG: TolC family protein [Gemmatimonadaceae bacterium]|nr:TolC family protein [Gemmatimonadaceae bacterium]